MYQRQSTVANLQQQRMAYDKHTGYARWNLQSRHWAKHKFVISSTVCRGFTLWSRFLINENKHGKVIPTISKAVPNPEDASAAAACLEHRQYL
jgi:hypothetical protein